MKAGTTTGSEGSPTTTREAKGTDASTDSVSFDQEDQIRDVGSPKNSRDSRRWILRLLNRQLPFDVWTWSLNP
jgi:hypothetical protein